MVFVPAIRVAGVAKAALVRKTARVHLQFVTLL
jgi:hypothetical protein